MILNEMEQIATASLPVVEFSEHLRLGSGFADDGSEDAVLQNYLRAALAAVEAQTGKAIFERLFQVNLNAWRGNEQGLPIAPIADIVSMNLVDQDGGSVLVDGAKYRLVRDAHRPCVAGAHGALPAIPNGGHAEVVLRAGFAPDWSGLPENLRLSVLMLAANFFEDRHGLSSASALPVGVANLLAQFRPFRLGGRA